MTQHGIHHNACFDNSRLHINDVRRWLPSCARSLAYYRDDQSGWRTALHVMRELAELGVKNLVIANTETLGGGLLTHELNAQRLKEFLELSTTDEFRYYDNERKMYRSPVHEVEPLNEIDTPGWDDNEGGPVTADKVVNYTYNLHNIARDFLVDVIGPSFLGGPLSELPVSVISKLAQDGIIKVATFHTYGRSIRNEPSPGWIWGDTEAAINDILTYCGNMLIDITEQGCWTVSGNLGEDAQRDYVKAFCRFNHPKVRRMYLFANNDWVPFDGEYFIGKDFGMVTRDGLDKQSALVFKGDLIIEKPQPTNHYAYVLGFRDFYNVLLAGGIDPGEPLENEWGPWALIQQQITQNGMFSWAETPLGGRLSYMHRGIGLDIKPRRFRWEAGWQTYQEMFEGTPR